FIKNNCESYHIYHYISPEKDAETKVNWKRLASKYHLTKWYDPLPRVQVEGLVIISETKGELNLFSNIIETSFNLENGERFKGFLPHLNMYLENGIVKKIDFNN